MAISSCFPISWGEAVMALTAGTGRCAAIRESLLTQKELLTIL
jgi:hypothetical protein